MNSRNSPFTRHLGEFTSRMLMFVFFAFLLAPVVVTRAQDASSRVDALIASMTLEQKVAQMFLVGLYGPVINEPVRDFLNRWQPGGAVLFVSNAGTPDAVTKLTNSWQQTVINAGGLPMFIATDQEGGQIARLKDGFTTWPVPMLLTASGNVGLAYKVGQAMAEELRGVGVNMNLSPVADLYTNLSNPVIGRRSFGSEPGRTGQMLAGLIRGMQAGGVLATAKHFPGHGDTDMDSHTSLPVVRYGREELQQVEFAPFEWTIAAGVESIMAAHIWYPALDPGEPLPASLSPNIITGLLRGEMNFNGLVMTDAIEMDAIDTVYSYGQASVLAIQAGIDVVAFGAHLSPDAQGRAMQTVVDAVRNGTLTETRINESVLRILNAKQRYGLLDWVPLDPTTAIQRVNAPAHAEIVRELFRAGTTVAYDKGGLLPLDYGGAVTIIYPGTRPAVRRECEAYHDPAQTRWVTVSERPGASEVNAAAQAAASAEVVVVFTENAQSNGQGALVNALPQDKTVAVALFSPYDWMAFPDVAAYITTYSPLEPGIPAACAVLFGAIASNALLPVALDGRREFDNGGASIAFAPTQGSPEPINSAGGSDASTQDTLRNTASALGLPTETQTHTRVAPVSQSGTRSSLVDPTAVSLIVTDVLPPPTVPAMPTATATVEVAITPTLTPFNPTVTPTTPPTAVAQLPGESATGAPAVILPPSAGSIPSIGLLLAGGALGLAVTLYGGAFIQGERARRRYVNGFAISRCPACGADHLQVKVQVKRVIGIADARHAVRCAECHSILRETPSRRWKYRINPRANPALYARYDGKTVDTRTLRSLERGK